MKHSFAILGNTCHAYLGNTRLYETPNPSFLFDVDTACVLRHGPLDEMVTIQKGLQASYVKCELDPQQLEVISFKAEGADPKLLCCFIEKPFALAAWRKGQDPMNFEKDAFEAQHTA